MPQTRDIVVAAGLALLTGLLFWPVIGFDFTNYDDPRYVTANPHVLGGLTFENIRWAFLTDYAGNWHPLTWLSLMAGAQIFGPRAGGQHAINVILHFANAVLLFAFLRRCTAAFWRCAIVAALFAWHPLHVESVAWISERKDVLSAFFAFLTLHFYASYARAQQPSVRSLHYFAVILFFSLGLMSKPMLVTLPFLLLLLDYWPMRRMEAGTPVKILILEKVPFLLLAIATGIITIIAQKHGGNVQSLVQFPPGLRIENVFIAYARYLEKTFLPTNLAVYYPHPGHWPLSLTFAAALFIIGASVAAIRLARRVPFLFTGWFWFLGLLVPVIGLVQVGDQSLADRYTYLPLIGLFIALVWGMSELMVYLKWPKPVVGLITVLTLALLAVQTTTQLHYWHDSTTLFRHAIAVTGPNYLAQNNLGDALLKNGDVDEAISHFQSALEIQPKCEAACENLGEAYLKKNQENKAISYFNRAVQLDPNDFAAQNNFAGLLVQNGHPTDAIEHYQSALAADPDNANIHRNLATTLLQIDRLDDAIVHLQRAVELRPDDADSLNNLAGALFQKGRLDEAATLYQRALVLHPDSLVIQNNLARIIWQLANPSDPQKTDVPKAIELAQAVNRLSGGKNPAVLSALAAGYAGTGKFPEAASIVQVALPLIPPQDESALRSVLAGQLKSYSAGVIYQESEPPAKP